MRRFSLIAPLAVALLCGAPAFAETGPGEGKTAEHLKLYARLQTSVALNTSQHPRLAELRTAISGDCGNKVAGRYSEADTAQYCFCAGVMVTALWLSDAEIRQDLLNFADGKDRQASEFLEFQGPELYQPMCELVIANSASVERKM